MDDILQSHQFSFHLESPPNNVNSKPADVPSTKMSQLSAIRIEILKNPTSSFHHLFHHTNNCHLLPMCNLCLFCTLLIIVLILWRHWPPWEGVLAVSIHRAYIGMDMLLLSYLLSTCKTISSLDEARFKQLPWWGLSLSTPKVKHFCAHVVCWTCTAKSTNQQQLLQSVHTSAWSADHYNICYGPQDRLLVIAHTQARCRKSFTWTVSCI